MNNDRWKLAQAPVPVHDQVATACSGKKGFDTYDLANRIAEKQRHSRNRGRVGSSATFGKGIERDRRARRRR